MDPDTSHSKSGIEWIVDAHGCSPEALRSERAIGALFDQIVRELGLHPIGEARFHVFPAPGVRFAGEDPCLWVEGDTIVCVIHDMGTAYSPHSRALVRFESKDGVRWTNRGAILSRGGIHRLERPYVLSLPEGERLLFAASKPSAAGESSQVVAYPGLLPAKPAGSSRPQEAGASVSPGASESPHLQEGGLF